MSEQISERLKETGITCPAEREYKTKKKIIKPLNSDKQTKAPLGV